MKHESPVQKICRLSSLTLSLGLFLLVSPGTGQEIGVMQFPEGKVQHVVRQP
jgi:hypothetical protein